MMSIPPRRDHGSHADDDRCGDRLAHGGRTVGRHRGRRRHQERWQAWSPRVSGVVKVVAAGLTTLGVLLVLTAAIYWHGQGGRWFVVTSPSMGTAAPVGSLLLTEPTPLREVTAGTFITFHAPGSGVVFSHRAVAQAPGGSGVLTRGDANLVDDPWTVTDQDLIGRVVAGLPGLGWAARALPILACGLAITWLLTVRVSRPRRFSLRLTGSSLTFAVTGLILHPWVGLTQLAQTTPDDGSSGVLMKVISTGLLPIRVNDFPQRLRDGQITTVHLAHAEHGRYPLTAHLQISWWQWALVLLLVLSPLMFTTVCGLPSLPEVENPDRLAIPVPGAGGPDDAATGVLAAVSMPAALVQLSQTPA